MIRNRCSLTFPSLRFLTFLTFAYGQLCLVSQMCGLTYPYVSLRFLKFPYGQLRHISQMFSLTFPYVSLRLFTLPCEQLCLVSQMCILTFPYVFLSFLTGNYALFQKCVHRPGKKDQHYEQSCRNVQILRIVTLPYGHATSCVPFDTLQITMQYCLIAELYMVVMICVALIVLPTQVNHIKYYCYYYRSINQDSLRIHALLICVHVF